MDRENHEAVKEGGIRLAAPMAGNFLYRQNAAYPRNTPDYVNNSDGTIIEWSWV
jgi:hypothetical protein